MHRWRKSVEIMPLSTLVSGDHLSTLPLWRVMQFGLKPLTADFWRAIPHHDLVIQTLGPRPRRLATILALRHGGRLYGTPKDESQACEDQGNPALARPGAVANCGPQLARCCEFAG